MQDLKINKNMLLKKNYKYKQNQQILLCSWWSFLWMWNEFFFSLLQGPPCYAWAPYANWYMDAHIPLMRVCAVCSTLSTGRDGKRSTEFCDGHICWASVWPWSRVCSSTCTSQRCSRSGRSCTDWREVPLLHTRRCLCSGWGSGPA